MSTRGASTYKTLEVLGPEHEFSVVDDELRVLPIVDEILKGFHGRVVNSVELARPNGRSARAVCESLYAVAWKNASHQDRKYLPIVRKRIDNGSLSEIIPRE